jgi:hypothetical protein
MKKSAAVELQELDKILSDVGIVPIKDEWTKQTLNLGHSTEMLLEELEDFDLYEVRQTVVNGDLLKYFDNPSIHQYGKNGNARQTG